MKSLERLTESVPSESATTKQPDAIVIGAGSAGLTVAIGLSRLGRTCVLIEAHEVGGECTNVGCIPSKSLLHHSANAGERSGSTILEAVRQRRNDLRDTEIQEVHELEGVDFRAGSARMIAADKVEITDPGGARAVVTAKHIVVASGSSARRLPVPGLPEDRYLTNNELFEVVAPPKHLVIVGAGPIGAEMATAFLRLGSRVTILEAAPRVMPGLLPEASAVAHSMLEAAGAVLKPGLVAKRFDPATDQLHIGPVTEDAETDFLVDVDAVLVAAGRIPNTEGLGLEALGVQTDQGGRILIDDRGQTSVKGVWAAGDVSTEGGTTHAASIWGRRILKAIVAPYGRTGDRPVHPAVTFAKPEIATIGSQLETVPNDVMRIRINPADADRGYTDEIADGLVLVDVRRLSGKILGATIIAPRAGELVSIFSLAMKTGIPLHKFYGTVWPYPSYADVINHVVDEYMTETLQNIPRDAGRFLVGRLRSVFRRS